ncbi:flavin-containing monooxygenase [Nocardia nova]|uniref:flavin-containing monooxygenase n=1 Tax=Nocardia nova TaxID=37330 RepID=UPI0033ED1CE1
MTTEAPADAVDPIAGLPFSPPLTASDAELEAALAVANIPTLLLVIAQLTEDPTWLEGRFRPSRTVALNDNDTAGLDEDRQAQVRAAAFEILRDIRDGRRPTPPPPADDRIAPLLSLSLGEEVPAEYGALLAEEGGFRLRDELEWPGERPARADTMHVVVIGAGPSGIAAAAALAHLGIRFTVIERNESVGGVWNDNTYPGAGVDTPAHLYSFSFAPKPNWSRYYAKQPEVLDYFRSVAQRFGLERFVRFGTRVRSTVWQESTQTWAVDIENATGAETLTADAVISCVGALNEPAIPDLPGIGEFDGAMFHSARWDHSVDLTGKRVAIIGTGATAMQIVPAIADRTERTLVFQRTPQWIVPNGNYLRNVDEGIRLLMQQVPYYASFYRMRLIWQFQDKLLATLERDPEWPHKDRSVNAANDKHRAFLTKAMTEQLGDDAAALQDTVVPGYPPYSKRILMDNEWISTIRRPDVELIAQRVSGFDSRHVLTADGARHRADVVVFATGFQSRKMLSTFDVRGREGTTLRDRWGDDDASAYLGITVPGFPNFFIVGGPQTTPAHGGSALLQSECAVNYIARTLVRMATENVSSVEVRADVAEHYDARVDAEHEQLVWTHPGTDNWYRNAKGRVINAIPWRLVDYRAMTEQPDLAEYVVRRR